jgi:hypothetical protein
MFTRINMKNTGLNYTYNIIEEKCKFYDSFLVVGLVVVSDISGKGG